MKRSLTPTVTTLEDRLALSTTSPTIMVRPPTITGSIDTLTPPPTDGQLQWLGDSNAIVIIPLNSGTGQTFHFLTIITTEKVEPLETDPLGARATVPIALATSPLTFSPVSQLS